MAENARVPVKFDHPPVVEVAFGLTFSLNRPLQSAHFGSFWEKVRPDFPVVNDASPLQAIFETSDSGATAPDFKVQVLEMPPLRRVWYAAKDGRQLIQLQADRFFYNWKRVEDSDSYPGFEQIFSTFLKQSAAFAEFLGEMELGLPKYSQLELIYTNLIGQGNGLNVVPPSRLLVDHIHQDSADRFLPQPENFNWNSTYSLPDRLGRLYINAQTARRISSSEPVVRLDAIARGLPIDNTDLGRAKWFHLAHEWITQGFADATVMSVQNEVWGRTT